MPFQIFAPANEIRTTMWYWFHVRVFRVVYPNEVNYSGVLYKTNIIYNYQYGLWLFEHFVKNASIIKCIVLTVFFLFFLYMFIIIKLCQRYNYTMRDILLIVVCYIFAVVLIGDTASQGTPTTSSNISCREVIPLWTVSSEYVIEGQLTQFTTSSNATFSFKKRLKGTVKQLTRKATFVVHLNSYVSECYSEELVQKQNYVIFANQSGTSEESSLVYFSFAKFPLLATKSTLKEVKLYRCHGCG